MTKLLEKAFTEASKLPKVEQNALAKWLLKELEAEKKWDDLFAESESLLDQLADEALEEQIGENKTKLCMSKNMLQKFAKGYDNPVIRALIQLIPLNIGSALDVVLLYTIDRIRNERAKAFFDELADGKVSIDESCLESEDFLHKYFKTTKYALNTRRREKIRLFARLLKSSLTNGELREIDEYEEYLDILDDINYKELRALIILDECSTFSTIKNPESIIWTDIWVDMRKRLETEMKIANNEVDAFMAKIVRTGCFELITGTYLGYIGGMGKLTPIYKKLKKYIQFNASGL